MEQYKKYSLKKEIESQNSKIINDKLKKVI